MAAFPHRADIWCALLAIRQSHPQCQIEPSEADDASGTFGPRRPQVWCPFGAAACHLSGYPLFACGFVDTPRLPTTEAKVLRDPKDLRNRAEALHLRYPDPWRAPPHLDQARRHDADRPGGIVASVPWRRVEIAEGGAARRILER